MADPDPSAKPRIAIKLGGLSSSNRTAQSSRPQPSSSLGKRSRPANLRGDSDSDAEGDDRRGDANGRHDSAARPHTNGSVRRSDRPDKPSYVVQRLPNRDWRSEIRGRRGGKLPDEAREVAQTGATEIAPADLDTSMKWGLTVKQKQPQQSGKDVEAVKSWAASPVLDAHPSDQATETEPNLESEDQEALDALLGKGAAVTKKDYVISHAQNAETEEDAYKRSVRAAGETSTLKDYENMPVEEFGAALLRGMGWNGQHQGSVKQPKRRPNLVGLGAKDLSQKDAEDLGAWNQKAGGRTKPPRLSEYRREDQKRRDRLESRHHDSYKHERDRERR